MRKLGLVSVAALVAALGTAEVAAAQVCGDANGNDTVSVTDGVQALRAAAALSSTCEDGCDIDGSGAVTVSDGVNILRKAAGIAINEACDFTTQEANSVVGPSFGLFDALTKVPGVGSSSLVASAATGCDNDGSVVTMTGTSGSASTTTFTSCEIGGTIFDGVIGRIVLGDGFTVGFQDFTITRNGKTHGVSGQLGVTTSAEGRRISGKLTVDSSDRGTYTIEFQRILVIADGSVRQGLLVYDLSDASTPKIAGIRITFDESDDLAVTILLRNKQVRQLILDRNTRLLHLPG
jgi:hypothetical protein